jgi:hypothetical protein
MSMLALVILLLAVASYGPLSAAPVARWFDHLAQLPAFRLLWLACGVLFIQRVLVRIYLCARIYGLTFALLVPLRIQIGTVINCVATASAFIQFNYAGVQNKKLKWLKTEHNFVGLPLPGVASLAFQPFRTTSDMAAAIALSPVRALASVYRFARRKLRLPLPAGEFALAGAAASASFAPATQTPDIAAAAFRALPFDAVRKYKAVPFRFWEGRLLVACPPELSRGSRRKLSRRSYLKLEFVDSREDVLADLRKQYFSGITETGPESGKWVRNAKSSTARQKAKAASAST